jgi:exosome complex component RRP4
MNHLNRFNFLAIIIAIFISFVLSESKNFEFDVKNLNYEQRDKLFAYLDPNKDSILTRNEFNLLLQKLFFSNKLNKPYVIDESVKEKLFKFMDFNQNKKIDREEFNKIWDQWICVILKPKSALIVVDMQNDFLADNGSLKIENGVSIVPVINKLIASIKFNTIAYTYDWHPPNHCSFIENKNLRPFSCNQRLWPQHCVQNTYGAQLYKDLKIADNSFNVYKGMDPEIDSYSAFFDNQRVHKNDLSDKLLAKGMANTFLNCFKCN